MNFKYILSILLVLSGAQSLISSEEAPKAPKLTFKQEYDKDPEKMTQVYGEALKIKFCQNLPTEEETINCHRATQDFLPLLFGRKESAIPYQRFQNKAEWEAWLQQRPKALVMITKSGCFGCAAVHAFLGSYVEKCRKKGMPIVAMSSKDLANIEQQGVTDFTSCTSFPELFPINDGKVFSTEKIDPLNDQNALMAFLRNHCS